MGVVMRYIDFIIILLSPTPLVLALILQQHPQARRLGGFGGSSGPPRFDPIPHDTERRLQDSGPGDVPSQHGHLVSAPGQRLGGGPRLNPRLNPRGDPRRASGGPRLIGERSEPHTYRTVGKNLRHIYIYVFYIYIYIYTFVRRARAVHARATRKRRTGRLRFNGQYNRLKNGYFSSKL